MQVKVNSTTPKTTTPQVQDPASTTLTELQDIIARVTGIDPEAIMPSTFLEELSLEDFPRIIGNVNMQFGIVLKSKDILQDCETIQDLVNVIEEEQELG